MCACSLPEQRPWGPAHFVIGTLFLPNGIECLATRGFSKYYPFGGRTYAPATAVLNQDILSALQRVAFTRGVSLTANSASF